MSGDLSGELSGDRADDVDDITARDQDEIGTRDVGPQERDPDADVPPEQAPGGVEVHPDPPIPPKSGYPSRDPRSDETPYDPTPRH